MKAVEILSRQDMKEAIKEETGKCFDFVYNELSKLRLRINDLEQVIKIYDGKIKISGKNEQ